jgi:hexosaminidase
MNTIKSVLIVFLTLAMSSLVVSSEVLPIIPMPAQLERQEGVFTLTPAARIVADDSAKDIADRLKQTLADSGVDLKVEPISETVSNTICFKLNPDLAKELGPEGYRLSVTTQNIDIQAAQPTGLFYGMQTLLQLLPEAVYAQTPSPQTQWTVPCVRIQDVPRFAWRGMHLDVCRHFMPKEFVKKYIDLLALIR